VVRSAPPLIKNQKLKALPLSMWPWDSKTVSINIFLNQLIMLIPEKGKARKMKKSRNEKQETKIIRVYLGK